VVLEFKDGDQCKFDAVVGCDGVRSVVRDHIVGDTLNYLGVLAINGIASNFQGHPLCDNRAFQTLDGKHRLFVKPFSEQMWMWQLSFPFEEAMIPELIKNKPKMFQIVHSILNNWHSPIPDLLAHTDVNSLRGGGIYDRSMPDSKPWRQNFDPKCHNITIMGDAAHPMSPFKGQGANSALEDSWRLFSLFHDRPHALVDEIFSEFEDQMWAKTRDRVLHSRMGVQFLHTREALDSELLFQFLHLSGHEKEKAIASVTERNSRLAK